MPSPEIDFPHTDYDRRAHLVVSTSFTLYPLAQHASLASMFIHDSKSMAVMSHEIEDNLSRSTAPADLYSGFQHLSRFLSVEHRYRHLAGLGHTLYVFGIPDIDPPLIPGIYYIPLTENHALAREWFVIASTAEFCSALVAEELFEFSSSKRDEQIGTHRHFQGSWTFDPPVISALVHHLRDELDIPLSLQTVHQPHDQRKQLDAIVRSTNQLVNELELRNQAINSQQKLYEDLVDMLVHDLRGSLTSVIGSLEILASGRAEQPDDAQALIDNSLENSRRLANMITNMLDINKYEAGHLHINREVVNLHDLLLAAVGRWNLTAGWSGKTITTRISAELPLLIGDTDMLERVLDNLLSNAIKYGTMIQLEASYSSKLVSISVIDDGPGIAPADREIIFEKFMQANLGSAQRKGTGLGLAFCKMAVEAHGGTIQCLSPEFTGTEFKISLPISPPHPLRPGKLSERKRK